MSLNNNIFDINRIAALTKVKRFFDNCPIEVNILEDIYNDYCSVYQGKLENTKNEIVGMLAKSLPDSVHSLRGRVKDPDHLIEKIVRNVAEKPQKYQIISRDNYYKIITDLIGIRIIILDKRDWRDVHECLLEIFENDENNYIKNETEYIDNYDKYKLDDPIVMKGYHAEKPIVYITSQDDRITYKDDNLIIDQSKIHYRSIHYIIRYHEVLFEIQVRTLFEEGWLEFDHRYNYPYDKSNVKKRDYISILNSLAQASDKLISFYDDGYFEMDDDKGNASDNEDVDVEVMNADNSYENELKRRF